MKIEMINIDKLTHFQDNSKIHTQKQVQHIANSIEKFGFNDPLGISGEDNIILEGNGRLEAAKLLGYKELPCVRLDHLTDVEKRAYVISHNATTLETQFDDGILFSELKKLDDFDFSKYGLDAEKYLNTLIRVQKRLLKQIKKVHYLISLDINKHNSLIYFLDEIKNIEGIEIESTTN